jgi:hypothetical protein
MSRLRKCFKLIGKDIIVVHQLLKNNIEQHEYWLVTGNLLPDAVPEDFINWMKWNSSAKQTEIGEIPFHYTQLGQLKAELEPQSYPQLELLEKVKMISLSRKYDTDIITLFHASGDFNFRSAFQKSLINLDSLVREIVY